MAGEVFAKYVRAYPQYAPNIQWSLMQKYPELRAACDEACPDHINIRKRDAIKCINGAACNFHIGYDYFADDYDVALAAVKSDPLELRYVSDRLKGDKSIVMEVVSRNGIALQFASGALKDDEDIVTAAVTQNINSIKWAGPQMLNNKRIADLVKKQNSYYLSHMGPLVLTELKILNETTVITDKEQILTLIKQNPLNYKYASPELRGCGEVLFAALDKWRQPIPGSPHLFDYIPECLLHDREVAIAAMKRDGYGLSYFPHFNNDEEVVLAATINHNGILKFAAPELYTNRNFMMRAIKIRANMLWTDQAQHFIKDPEFIDEVLATHPHYLTYFC